MITQSAKDTADAIVSALNSRIPEYETAYKLMVALYWSGWPDGSVDPNWKLATWARELDIDGYKWDLTKFTMNSGQHTSRELSRYFVIPFMGCEIAIGITGEIYNGAEYWDNEISYGIVKYQPYFSKGLK